METPEEIAAREAAEKEATAAAAAAAADTGGEGGGISPEAQAQIEELREALRNKEAERIDAENRATRNASTAATAMVAAEDAELQLVATAIETVTATQTALKSRYSAALSAQDYDAAADIQAEMSTNAAQLVQLRNGKQAMEDEKAKPKRQPQQGDPVETLAATLTPKSAAWVRAHPEYVTNIRLNRKMLAAHESALNLHDCAPDSPEYFGKVEELLGIKKANGAAPAAEVVDEAMSAAAGATKRRDEGGSKAPPALPASRGGERTNAKRLTPEEQEIAKLNGMTDEEYATQREALKKEGRLH